MLYQVFLAVYLFTTFCVSAVDPDNVARKRNCRIGIHSHNCALLDLEDLKKIQYYLNSGESPGKRDSEQSNGEASGYEKASDGFSAAFDLSNDDDPVEQRPGISALKKLLQDIRPEPENIQIQKRDCRFRLGGHCLTEALDRAANQYYYLKSPDSPGRRRRSVTMSS